MFGLFRRNKQDAVDADDRFEAEFDRVIRYLSTAPTAERLAVAWGVSFAWKFVNAKYRSAEELLKLSHEAQRDCLEQLTKLGAAMAQIDSKTDSKVRVGVALTKMYLVALINGRVPMANRMADRLEPLNIEGSQWMAASPLPTGDDEAQ